MRAIKITALERRACRLFVLFKKGLEYKSKVKIRVGPTQSCMVGSASN